MLHRTNVSPSFLSLPLSISFFLPLETISFETKQTSLATFPASSRVSLRAPSWISVYLLPLLTNISPGHRDENARSSGKSSDRTDRMDCPREGIRMRTRIKEFVEKWSREMTTVWKIIIQKIFVANFCYRLLMILLCFIYPYNFN